MDIGKRIRDLREERGLTQREVARRAGLTPSGVGFIEHGQTRNPSAETVMAVARALGVEVGDLLREPAPLDSGPSAPVWGGAASVDLQEARRIKRDLEVSERARETVAYARERFDLSDAEAEILRQYVQGFQNPKPQPFAVVELMPKDGSPGVDHAKIRGVLQQMIEEDRLDPEQVKAVAQIALSQIAS